MRELIFVPPNERGFMDAIAAQAAKGAPTMRVHESTGPLAQTIAKNVGERYADALTVSEASIEVLTETDSERLSAALIGYLDRTDATVIAPATDRYWPLRSLFLISIPKSGTHLLTELARAFGYKDGDECPATAERGYWHYLEFTNSHTAAPDFFVDTVRRRPYGNRDHPFRHHPSLFIYRNPLDILASEANYYQEDGATVFAGYLEALSYEERLLRLVDDPWVLGSIRDRIARFAGWLDVTSVIPVSFEELVGPQGGGNAQVQQDTIWSLMLRLHVPGKPTDFADKVFNPNSPTFRHGRIGGHAKRFTPEAWTKFRALPQDFMVKFGFAEKPASGPWLPSHAVALRRRVPRYSHVDPGATPILVRKNFLSHNIIRYQGRYFAVPKGHPHGDLVAAPPDVLAKFTQHEDLTTLEWLVHTLLSIQFTNQNPHLIAPRPSAPPPPISITRDTGT